MLNPLQLKKEFPIFDRTVNGKPLMYLDNASTTQKPQSVLDELLRFYSTMNANIHRGVHTLSEEATTAYEHVREQVRTFLNAADAAEIIFTRNTTESINLVASTYGEQNIYSGDVIVVSALEHHSNLVPWQQLCKKKGAELKIIPMMEDGTLDLSGLDELIDERCKIVAVTQVSNVLGTVVPLKKIIEAAHRAGAIVLVDGAQGVPHCGVNVQELDCDFLAFSAHKMFGPTGVGVLYGKKKLLEDMPPFLFGGDMVKEVDEHHANWNDLPWKFEAGTPNIGGVVAFGKAIEFLQSLNMNEVQAHEATLVRYAREKLAQFPDLRILGPASSAGAVSFHIPGVHPHDVASILNEAGVAIRAGHHCAQPTMKRLQVPATSRMSFSVYTTTDDIDAAIEALKDVYKIFKR
ncbi:MAG: cysteine desulfurase [Candidatus Gracilibacteria bacterium]